MLKIRITKEIRFEMAHALWNYDGLCKNIHGHSYKLFITILGSPISDENNPKLGMVMDFSDLKQILKEEIIDVFDHSLVISKKADQAMINRAPEMFDRLIVTEYQPTCENMVADFAQKISSRLPREVELYSLRLYETETSYAEWFANDQA